jgi:hypothetical protein
VICMCFVIKLATYTHIYCIFSKWQLLNAPNRCYTLRVAIHSARAFFAGGAEEEDDEDEDDEESSSEMSKLSISCTKIDEEMRRERSSMSNRLCVCVCTVCVCEDT